MQYKFEVNFGTLSKHENEVFKTISKYDVNPNRIGVKYSLIELSNVSVFPFHSKIIFKSYKLKHQIFVKHDFF